MNLKKYVEIAPSSAGVYRMLDIHKNLLYVGKAKNIANRLAQYLQINNLSIRIQKMVAQIDIVEFIVCKTEKEALLLEANLIKSLKPKYNILLKDDKSFPYLVIRTDHQYPQLIKYRGKKNNLSGKYFGPFASIKNLNIALEELQKIFPLRTCSDHYLASRIRPCIQYEIKKCSAPCVNKISQDDYNNISSELEFFLKGNTSNIQDSLVEKMQLASDNLEYEKAANYRDRIVSLNQIQSKKYVSTDLGNSDIIALYIKNYQCCIEIFFFRSGQNLGNKSYYPEQIEDLTPQEILAAFIVHFYQNHEVPKNIIINYELEEKKSIEDLFNIKIFVPKLGEKKRILDFAIDNAKNSLNLKLVKNNQNTQLLLETKNTLNIKNNISRIDVFDNSHLSGTNAVSAMIVFVNNIFSKKEYRLFKFKEANTENDYAMMAEAVKRRYSKLLLQYPSYEEEKWPDLILIDGGPGHLAVITEVLDQLSLDIPLFCIAKGATRTGGKETFYSKNQAPFTLSNHNMVMQFMQRLRDEAHRFAIENHRKNRNKENFTTSLDHIDFIGERRKKLLLNYFGSVSSIKDASIDELRKVKSISKNIAEQIYNYYKN
jgi:excinuclease ABC subunit C